MTDLAQKKAGGFMFYCHTGNPLWLLTPDVIRIISRWAEYGEGYHLVQFQMKDGREVNTAVAMRTWTELPDPYVPRDIKIVRQLLP